MVGIKFSFLFEYYIRLSRKESESERKCLYILIYSDKIKIKCNMRQNMKTQIGLNILIPTIYFSVQTKYNKFMKKKPFFAYTHHHVHSTHISSSPYYTYLFFLKLFHSLKLRRKYIFVFILVLLFSRNICVCICVDEFS